MKPSKSLILFRDTVCPDLPLDSLQLFYHLLDEISKLKEKMEA